MAEIKGVVDFFEKLKAGVKATDIRAVETLLVALLEGVVLVKVHFGKVW